ncbi:MAG: helix-turn-helix transcriptional regulator [Candidatus Limiplasma sp.]|nr:helix-turn-helix transcriptional regulator [Candidatus Limiplasma sp.]
MHDRIKDIRKALDMTQTEFAQRIGIKQNSLANIEIGRRNASNQVVISICREFGVNQDYLLKGEEPMFIPKEEAAHDRIDQLLSGGNNFVKAVFIELADLSDEEWQVLHDFVQRVMDRTKNPGQ